MLIVGLVALGVFALWTQQSIVSETARSDSTVRLAAVYQDARFWVSQEESLERQYRLEPGAAILGLHGEAERRLTADLKRVSTIDTGTATRLFVGSQLRENDEYIEATRSMFAAVLAHKPRLVAYYDHVVTDPVFSSLEAAVYGRAAAASRDAFSQSNRLRRRESAAFQADLIALALALLLVGGLSAAVRHGQTQRQAMRVAELERLKALVVTDPLTGLRNHRAFHEDLAVDLQRTGRTGVPVSLVMFDADDLKAVNDTHGHQAGDELLKKLAEAISAMPRATDRAYRIGGDEFAVILHGAGEWEAFEFAHRLRASLTANVEGNPVLATAGISQALQFRRKDRLIREADLALMSAKHADQDVAIYTPEMESFKQSSAEVEDEQHTRTLAKALALAVDAKDSHTRSHCQTVATLCAVIATELGFEDGRLKRMRLAGLLHDVGKIGIPDSILKKPAKLDPAEYEVMKTHSVLGESIILAAEMPVEARWVRHHHERIDGRGYPDGLAGEDIPLEARVIHVADAFEAMTSDRPYRAAPGEEFAIEELQRHSGTQFDADVVDALLRVIGGVSLAASPGPQLAVGASR